MKQLLLIPACALCFLPFSVTAAENQIGEIHKAFFCVGALSPASLAGVEWATDVVSKWIAYGDALLAEQYVDKEADFLRLAFYNEGLRKLVPEAQDLTSLEFYGEECGRPPTPEVN